MAIPYKYYLAAENERNARNGDVYTQILRRAFGVDEVIMVGHHFVFEHAADMKALNFKSLNEMPSADTILFDHPIMSAVFGTRALPLMMKLASVPSESRDAIVRSELATLPSLTT